MSCECYQVGGRFIAEDPDCPAHGTEAQASRQRMEDAVTLLEDTVHKQAEQIRRWQEVVSQLGRNI
jgi:cytochrome c-type biogenesis protein CcmH/NrfG